MKNKNLSKCIIYFILVLIMWALLFSEFINDLDKFLFVKTGYVWYWSSDDFVLPLSFVVSIISIFYGIRSIKEFKKEKPILRLISIIIITLLMTASSILSALSIYLGNIDH